MKKTLYAAAGKAALAAALIMMMSSCSIYRKYHRPEDLPTDSLYRAELVPEAQATDEPDTNSLGYMSWEEVFTDPCLQDLIRTGLENNVDFRSAILRVEQAKAQLSAAKWGYAPSIMLAPQGGLNSINAGKASWTYNVGASASWDIDLFGSLLNAKRGAQAALLQQQAYQQAVRSQLIATIANTYFSLLMLDDQVAISEENVRIFEEQVRTMEAMLKTGKTTENAVTQARANLYGLEASYAALLQQQQEAENALCSLLGQPSMPIVRGKLSEQTVPSEISVGIPLQLLSNRPDVYQAEMALASSYYSTNQARSAFYPKISLSGSAGWTNSLGQAISNPAGWLLSALGQLTMPIFNHGQLVANLKVSKAEEEIALMNYRQTLLNAGEQVNNALYAVQISEEMYNKHLSQVKDLERTVQTSELLYERSDGTYLELLSARQSLLSARLNAVNDQFTMLQSVVSLYQALGGGKE